MDEGDPARRGTLAGRVRAAGTDRWLHYALVVWTIVGASLLVFIAFRYVLRPLGVLFPPLAIALVVVFLLHPVVSVLERRGIPRPLGVAVMYGAFVAIVSIVLIRVVPALAGQADRFLEALPGYLERASREFNDFALRRGWDNLRVNFDQQDVIQTIQDNRDAIFSFLGGVRSVATGFLHVLITLVVGFILSVYLLLDLPKLERSLVRTIPPHRRQELAELAEKLGRALGGFFRGQLLVATFVGVASALALQFIVKLPFGLLVGLIVGIFNLVPLIGPFLGAIPAVLIGLLSGQPSKALWAALALLIVQQVDNHIVSPNIMSRTVQLHPVAVMLAILAGGTIAGIFGMLIVIPAVAATKILAEHFWFRQAAPAVSGASGPPGPDP